MPTEIESKHVTQEIHKLESALANEAKADEQHLATLTKSLTHSQKDHNKAEKAAMKADGAVEKAIKTETKAARKLNDATHKHDVSITDQHKAEHARDLRQRSLADTDRNLTQHKAALDDAQRIKDTREAERDKRLSGAREAIIGHSSGAAGAQGA